MTDVLAGIRVLDFGRYIAGPYCAEILAQFGAEVIRIEKPTGGEDRYTTPVTDDGTGAMFLQMNCNKRGITLHPGKPEGREIVRRLVGTADVVLANLVPAALKRIGLDYESLRSIKQDIILTAVSTFGSVGPYSDRPGFDAVAQAMSGSVDMGGFPGQPMKSFAPYVDYGTGVFAALGTFAALMHKQQTGRGQKVEGALLATALAFNNSPIIEQALLQLNRVGSGNRAQHVAPSDIFKTRDGRAIVIQVVGNPLFERWAKLLGAEDWIDDPRFSSDASRGDNGALISQRAAAWCAERTQDQALAELEAARVPAGPVVTVQEAQDDSHVQAMGLFNPVEFPGLAHPAPVASAPVQLSESPPKITSQPPLLGEHTDVVLAELGYSKSDVAEFRRKRVI